MRCRCLGAAELHYCPHSRWEFRVEIPFTCVSSSPDITTTYFHPLDCISTPSSWLCLQSAQVGTRSVHSMYQLKWGVKVFSYWCIFCSLNWIMLYMYIFWLCSSASLPLKINFKIPRRKFLWSQGTWSKRWLNFENRLFVKIASSPTGPIITLELCKVEGIPIHVSLVPRSLEFLSLSLQVYEFLDILKSAVDDLKWHWSFKGQRYLTYIIIWRTPTILMSGYFDIQLAGHKTLTNFHFPVDQNTINFSIWNSKIPWNNLTFMWTVIENVCKTFDWQIMITL